MAGFAKNPDHGPMLLFSTAQDEYYEFKEIETSLNDNEVQPDHSPSDQFNTFWTKPDLVFPVFMLS